MGNLVQFDIPTEFILARATPTPAEMAYGYRSRRTTARQLVELAEAKVTLGLPVTDEELMLAELLPDEVEHVDGIVTRIEAKRSASGDEFRIWLFLALAWLLHRRASVPDPPAVVEMLFEDFDHPPEIYGLIRYMPVPKDEARGIAAIDQRWTDYVEKMGAEFRRRAAAGS
jgi:hypothetical protein